MIVLLKVTILTTSNTTHMQHATQPLVWLKTPVQGLSLRRQRHLFESILKCVDNGGHLFEWTIEFRPMFAVVATNIIECREVNRT